jgi:hypothetical protein
MNEGEAHSLSCCDAKTLFFTRWSSSIFESLQIDLRYWIRPRMHRLGIWINVNVNLFMWINAKSSIKHLFVLL